MLSIILATKGHPEQAIKVIHNLEETTIREGINAEIIVVSPSDEMLYGAQMGFKHQGKEFIHFYFDDLMNRMDAWNFGASKAKGEYLHGSADDLVYPPGWAKSTIEKLESQERKDLYCRIPCQLTECYWAETGIGHRDFFTRHMGGCIVVPHYKAIYTDVEMSDRAMAAGVFIRNDTTKIEHNWNGSAPPNVQHHDHDLYNSRKASGFPNNFQPSII